MRYVSSSEEDLLKRVEARLDGGRHALRAGTDLTLMKNLDVSCGQ